MTLATSLQNASRNLIETFGNSASLYSYSSATKTENDEGDIEVTNWGEATNINVVDGTNLKEELIQTVQGKESVGDDEKIIKDNVTIAVNDRLTADGVDYRIDSVKPVRTQSTLVIQIITVSRQDETAMW